MIIHPVVLIAISIPLAMFAFIRFLAFLCARHESKQKRYIESVGFCAMEAANE